MDIDLHVTRFEWAGAPRAIGPGLAELARSAETIGVKTLSLMDHFFQIEAAGAPEDPMLEGYTALGFLAGLTERLRLRLLVTGVTYRHPGLLAKIVTTLDVLSQGRGELGIGLIEAVNGHRFLLHDGRARDIPEAILWHGGEAEASREAFRNAPQDQREDLVAFLEAL